MKLPPKALGDLGRKKAPGIHISGAEDQEWPHGRTDEAPLPAYCQRRNPTIESDRMLRSVVLALCLLLGAAPSWASASRGSARSAPRSASRSAGRTTARSATRYKSPATKCTSCARTANGRIARSPAARRSFQASHPCPATGRTAGACKGYVIDHVIPLKRGGADVSSNMQWQTTAAAKAKDKIE